MRADDEQRILTEEDELERLGDPPGAPPRAVNVRKLLLWIGALSCLALLIATGGETWTLWREQQAVTQARVENARIQRDIQQTGQAISQAQSPAAIEREARDLGYIRPGETPIIIAQPQP